MYTFLVFKRYIVDSRFQDVLWTFSFKRGREPFPVWRKNTLSADGNFEKNNPNELHIR